MSLPDPTEAKTPGTGSPELCDRCGKRRLWHDEWDEEAGAYILADFHSCKEAGELVTLDDDGETGHVHSLTFHNRTLHRLVHAVEDDRRAAVVLDALDTGAEVLARATEHGDLHNLTKAIERLDEQSKRIVESTASQVERAVERTVEDLATAIQGEDGPLASVLDRFDPTTDGNVIDVFRDLVSTAASKATKQAVRDLSEATQDVMERMTTSLAVLEKTAAVEEARLVEAAKGTAKGLDHERDTETLLGELVGAAGDSLDDVSTIPGLLGTKKGDKTITPRNGCTIVTEEKCTVRITESKARTILDDAMANRGAELGMLIVDDETKVPGNQPFHFIDDDKVVVVAEPLPLRLVVAFFRAKAIELAGVGFDLDDAALVESVQEISGHVESIKRALERFRLLRTEHTKASKAIDQASCYVDEIADGIAAGVAEITMLIDGLVADAAEAA